MTGVRAALDNLATVPPPAAVDPRHQVTGPRAGRTRSRAVSSATKHAETMHTQPDAYWAKSLYNMRVQRIMKTNNSPQRRAKLGRAKAALLATMNELTDDHADHHDFLIG